MTAEYGSGRYIPIFTSSDVAVLSTGGTFSIAQTRTFWLYLMNEAGVSLPSPAVTVTAPIGGRISVSIPETNRDTATGYKYCFVVASLTNTLDDAWVVGFWRLFQTDSDAFATATPIIFSRDEHLVVPPAAVSLPAGLPTGANLVPGMTRLVSGGVASGASYYIYYPWLIVDPNSPYFRYAVDGDKVIQRSPGEYWVRFGNPNFGLFPIGGDIFGDTGACRPLVAVDEEFLAQNLLFGANYAAADNTDSVTASAKGLTVFFGSDTGDDILAGSRFGLNIQVDGFPATTLFDRRIVVRFLGFYNPVTGVLDTTSGLSDGASMAGIGIDMTQTNAETGFLAISKTLPGIQKAVFKIFPRFRASEIYPPLVQGSVISIVPILLPQGGTRVPLASIFETSVGGFVAPIADFGRVVPGDGTLNVLPGLFVVRGHESALQPKQTIAQITPNTLNQQLAVTQDGRAVVRGVAGVTALSGGEALLALFDFGTGESVASGWSNNIVLGSAGGISITATYPVSGAFGMVRSGIPEIAGNIQAYFNPPQVRIYIKLGSTIYRLNSPQPVVIGTTQVFTVADLTNTTVVATTTAPPFTDFCLFDPPTVSGVAISGSLAIGTYQVAIAYSFLSGTQCTRIRQATADGCIPAYRRSLFESNTSPIIQSLELLSTAGLIERTTGGSAAIVALSSFIRSFLDDANQATAQATLGLGAAATRNIGTTTGTIRDAADAAYTNTRTPTAHASTHLGGADSLGLGAAAFRAIGATTGTVRDAADAAYSNARTPTAHAATHAVGSTDSITVFGYLTVSVNSTLTASNQRQLIDVNATAGVITITLPSATTVGSGWAIQIRKSDSSANLVTISRAGSDTINGATTLSLAVQHQSLILFSLGGTSWGVVAGFPGTLPANSLLGTGATAGMVGVIPNSTFATPASVSAAIASLVNSSPAVLDTLGELATALGNDPNFATTITNSLALKANLNSPVLVTPNLGTPSAGVLTNVTGLPLGSGITGILGLGNGGTGATTQQAAINTLVGTQTASRVLRSDGTNIALSQVSLTTDVINTLPVSLGGTGQTTIQAAINSLAGGVTNATYLRGNGTNITLSVIQASDIPTLNQNTTGTASNITGIVAIGNGGTGSATRNFVDLTTAQSIGGDKTFTGTIAGISSTMVGLGSVDNTTDLAKPISTLTQSALNLKADLVSGLIPTSQLPSYVDDVLEFTNLASFPATGETGKVYVTLDTNLTYRWSGTIYVEISASLALGITSSTAYRGDFGNTAYLHSQTITGNPHNLTPATLGLGNVNDTSDASKPISTLTQTALDLKANLISPSFTTPNLGTPSAGILTNATELPLTGTTGTLAINRGGTGSTTQNFVDLTTTQMVLGSKTFLNSICVGGGFGSGLGFARLTNGASGNSGYLEIYKGGSDTRLGYIGFDNTNLNYVSEVGIHSFNGGAVSITSTVQSTSTTTGAHIVSGGQAVGGNLNVGGFTSLGDNVAIKKKLLSGTTASTQGATTLVAHGLNSTKIISITGLIYYQANGVVPLNSRQANYASVGATDVTNFSITNEANNSLGILSKLFYVVIEYIA